MLVMIIRLLYKINKPAKLSLNPTAQGNVFVYLNSPLRLKQGVIQMTGYEALMKLYPMTLENLDEEEWKPIPDYDGYEVSNFGRVKSFKSKTPKIKAPQVSNKGYLRVMLCNNAKQKLCTVHRLVARLFVPNPLRKPEVNHIDGHPLNCHFSNLEWVTRSENNQHAYDTKLKQSGEDRSDAKLTNEQARYIRENPDHLLGTELAKMFGVRATTITRIQQGKTYKNVGGVIRKARKVTYLPDELREQVRAEYKKRRRWVRFLCLS